MMKKRKPSKCRSKRLIVIGVLLDKLLVWPRKLAALLLNLPELLRYCVIAPSMLRVYPGNNRLRIPALTFGFLVRPLSSASTLVGSGRARAKTFKNACARHKNHEKLPARGSQGGLSV